MFVHRLGDSECPSSRTPRYPPPCHPPTSLVRLPARPSLPPRACLPQAPAAAAGRRVVPMRGGGVTPHAAGGGRGGALGALLPAPRRVALRSAAAAAGRRRRIGGALGASGVSAVLGSAAAARCVLVFLRCCRRCGHSAIGWIADLSAAIAPCPCCLPPYLQVGPD